MFESIQTLAGGLTVLLTGIAAGAAWIATIVAPNCSFDRLDYSRADGHVRQLLLTASSQIAGLLLAATATGVLAGAYGSAILSLIACFGFFTNRWTLAPKKKTEAPPGVRQRKKSQRVVAVGFSLMFAAVAAISAVLAVFNI